MKRKDKKNLNIQFSLIMLFQIYASIIQKR